MALVGLKAGYVVLGGGNAQFVCAVDGLGGVLLLMLRMVSLFGGGGRGGRVQVGLRH